MTGQDKPLGGFFELELPRAQNGVLSCWTSAGSASFFLNARSALAALVRELQPGNVWFPAYICPAFVTAVPDQKRRYYPVGRALVPDFAYLEASVRANDLVIGVNYFGRHSADGFDAFAQRHADIWFLEDCAQCLLPTKPWAHWRLFSPRKLMGVADGGVLIRSAHELPLPQPKAPAPDALAIWRASQLRFEDRKIERQAEWHAWNQEKESGLGASEYAMTEMSAALLEGLDIDLMAQKRRENFQILEAALAARRLQLSGEESRAPFAFPLIVKEGRRDEVLRGLHARRIYAAVHWRELPCPRDEFPEEHAMAGEMISLPCDQRYGSADMRRIVETAQALLSAA